MEDLSARIKMKGLELGFSHVGIIPCHDFPDYAETVRNRPSYERWVNEPTSFYAGCFPSQFFPQGKSIICATYGFANVDFPEKLLKHIATMYLARCYIPTPESIAGRRITAMTEFLESLGMEVFDNSIELPARPIAVESGVAEYGNNNFVRTEEDGSFVVVQWWLVDAELAYDEPAEPTGCPDNCRLCIDACPTGALEAPRRLNPARCILPNNLADHLEPGMEEGVGEHIHGCDICQVVCPRNHAVLHGPRRKDPFLESLAERFDLERVLMMTGFDDPYYRDVVYPIMYNYIRDIDLFRRNAAIALGNSGDRSHIAALQHAADTFPGTLTEQAARSAIAKLEQTTQA